MNDILNFLHNILEFGIVFFEGKIIALVSYIELLIVERLFREGDVEVVVVEIGENDRLEEELR